MEDKLDLEMLHIPVTSYVNTSKWVKLIMHFDSNASAIYLKLLVQCQARKSFMLQSVYNLIERDDVAYSYISDWDSSSDFEPSREIPTVIPDVTLKTRQLTPLNVVELIIAGNIVAHSKQAVEMTIHDGNELTSTDEFFAALDVEKGVREKCTKTAQVFGYYYPDGLEIRLTAEDLDGLKKTSEWVRNSSSVKMLLGQVERAYGQWHEGMATIKKFNEIEALTKGLRK